MKTPQHAIPTKTPQVWSHETRVYLYEQILEKIGAPWHRCDWELTAMRPKDWSNTDFNKTMFEEIYNDMEAKGFSMFKNTGSRNPKSADALKQQFQWCVTTQVDMAKGKLKYQRWNRMAAYEAGFLSMTEIVFLESFADMRFYTGV